MVLGRDPDIILCFVMAAHASVDWIKAQPAGTGFKAVRTGRVVH